eukprot:s3077_g1.t1
MTQWTTSNQTYGSFWKAVPLEPKVLPASATPSAPTQATAAAESRQRLAALMRRHGVKERPVEGDGNCQYRALSDQLYGSEEHHAAVRAQVVEHLRSFPDNYAS